MRAHSKKIKIKTIYSQCTTLTSIEAKEKSTAGKAMQQELKEKERQKAKSQ